MRPEVLDLIPHTKWPWIKVDLLESPFLIYKMKNFPMTLCSKILEVPKDTQLVSAHGLCRLWKRKGRLRTPWSHVWLLMLTETSLSVHLSRAGLWRWGLRRSECICSFRMDGSNWEETWISLFCFHLRELPTLLGSGEVLKNYLWTSAKAQGKSSLTSTDCSYPFYFSI